MFDEKKKKEEDDKETPKKCRDLIKTVRTLTNDHQFSSFGQVKVMAAFLS